MLTNAKLVGFILTKDYERSRAFYEGKMEFEFVSHDPFALGVALKARRSA